MTHAFDTIEKALEDLRAGKIILVTDDPDRENEGDFICAGEFATPENINFMAVHGRGLICMPELIEFARRHDMTFITIADLQAWIRARA